MIIEIFYSAFINFFENKRSILFSYSIFIFQMVTKPGNMVCDIDIKQEFEDNSCEIVTKNLNEFVSNTNQKSSNDDVGMCSIKVERDDLSDQEQNNTIGNVKIKQEKYDENDELDPLSIVESIIDKNNIINKNEESDPRQIPSKMKNG